LGLDPIPNPHIKNINNYKNYIKFYFFIFLTILKEQIQNLKLITIARSFSA